MPDLLLPRPTRPASRQPRGSAGQQAVALLLGLLLALPNDDASARDSTREPQPAQQASHRKDGASRNAQEGAKRKTAAPARKAQAGKAAEASRYAGHPGAEQLALEIAGRRGWELEWVRQWVGQAQQLPAVIRLSTPAPVAAAKNWAAYRARFIEPSRIEAGRRFWLEQRAALERAEIEYGVPAWLVVGIIGVETLYGRHTGSFRVLDALATLSLDFPASHPRAAERQAYFRTELEALLELARAQGLPPDAWRGSYAGAMGLPQFMPGSWLKYAVDFDGDGRVDLLNSPVDAIGSVAHYLRQHGWQPGMPTHYPVQVQAEGEALATLLAPDIKPSFDAARFHALGARLAEPALRHAGPLALVELRNGDPLQGGSGPSYVAGTENFYAVTRYNWSSYYALAVIELGQAVQAALNPPGAGR
ncbi:MAG: Membrane-bound lytic murein transglycosylase precursor [Pseudomonadota bacterium]|jgi:membrane-bound lytic murein transglycosylase B